MYADKITESMRKTIDETNRRREKQLKYNLLHNITPRSMTKSREEILSQTTIASSSASALSAYSEEVKNNSIAADPIVQYMDQNQLESAIKQVKRKMDDASKELDFIEAARLRDEIAKIKKL